MYKIIFAAVLLHLLSPNLFAADDNAYAVSKINPALLENACAVKRNEIVRFEIKDPGSANYYYKRVVTILNENGDEYADWGEGYDNKFFYIQSVSATLYDQDGKKIRSLKKADIADVSTAGNSLAADSRVKHHNFFCKKYPYTVEYEVEMKYDQLMFIPSWMPVEDEGYAVENSTFEIVTPHDYKIRYKVLNYDKDPLFTSGKQNLYHWEVKNLIALKKEIYSPSWKNITTCVFVAPTNFEFGGYKAVMDSWLNLGKFQVQLNENRDQLPDNVKKTIHALADTVKEVKTKIAILYKYMQSNTRYISIQLGIGGFQPLQASFVADKGYGDCKALSNYMCSILKEAGIKSYYTLIQSGDNNTFYLPDFPSDQSNHVILSVPLNKDTVWLECTSQNLSAGYLGGFTSNRYALMIKDDGGYLVHTPDYNCKENLQIRKITSVVNENGGLSAKVATRYTGLQQDDLFWMINSKSKKDQLEILKKAIDLPTYDVSSFDYKTTSLSVPAVDEYITLEADNYAQITGKRLFIQPNLLNKTSFKLPDEERKTDIQMNMGFIDEDSVEIKIPDGFTLESFPSPVNATCKFGTYKISYKLDGNTISMIRMFERKSGHFPKSDYKELVKMYNDMYKADRAKVVLIKKEG